MNGAFHVGGTGLSTQQKALDVIANNISNMNTQGFKRSSVKFSEIISDMNARTMQLEGAQFVGGTSVNIQFMLEEAGELQATGQAMDLAIDGAGFIELMGSNGQSLLWRGGHLGIDPEGFLAHPSGLRLRANINVPLDADNITITQDGLVIAQSGLDPNPIELGSIELVRPQSTDGMERLDGGLYRIPDTAIVTGGIAGEEGFGILRQGSLERSNVDLNSEMVQMMIVQRAYAANAQILQAADQIISIANNLRQ